MKAFSCWVVIPSRDFERGKSRLAPVIEPAERRAFSRECLRRVIKAARFVVGAGHTLVVSGAGEVLGLANRSGVRALRERQRGLNEAVQQAERFARRHGARGIVVIHSDLPQLTSKDIRRLIGALGRNGGVVLAPDRESSGTNALGVSTSQRFDFHFGLDSCALHVQEAHRRRMRVAVIRSPGLSCDVDTPEHFEKWGQINISG